MEILYVIFFVFWLLVAGWIYPAVKYFRDRRKHRNFKYSRVVLIVCLSWAGYYLFREDKWS